MDLTFKFDDSVVKKAFPQLEEKMPLIRRRAVNRSLISGRTLISTQIREDYTIKAATIKKSMMIIKPKSSNPIGMIRLFGFPLKTDDFKFTPTNPDYQKGVKVAKRRKATVTIKKGNKVVLKHAFSRRSPGDGKVRLFEKGEDGGRPKPIYTLSIPQMINQRNQEQVIQKIHDTYIKRFEHELEYELDKIGGKKT